MKNLLFVFLLLLVAACGSVKYPLNTTGPFFAEITSFEALYDIDYSAGPGYHIKAVFTNTGVNNIRGAYWSVESTQGDTWTLSTPLYLAVDTPYSVTTVIFKDGLYGPHYFIAKLYDSNNNVLDTVTIVSGYK